MNFTALEIDSMIQYLESIYTRTGDCDVLQILDIITNHIKTDKL